MDNKYWLENYGTELEMVWEEMSDEEKEQYLCDGCYIEGEDE